MLKESKGILITTITEGKKLQVSVVYEGKKYTEEHTFVNEKSLERTKKSYIAGVVAKVISGTI